MLSHNQIFYISSQHGANVNATDMWKFTPLHEAAAKGKYEMCKLLLKVCYHDVVVCHMTEHTHSMALTP